jgi:hypothetical protein
MNLKYPCNLWKLLELLLTLKNRIVDEMRQYNKTWWDQMVRMSSFGIFNLMVLIIKN